MFFKYIIARLAEASTWRGLVMLGMAAGLKVEPAMADQIVAAGAAVAGAIGMVMPDKK